jgi:hypothetical protein
MSLFASIFCRCVRYCCAKAHRLCMLYIWIACAAAAAYCANTEGLRPLAVVTQCSSLHPGAESLSHWNHISAFSSHSQCPLQYGPATHYAHASTVQPIAVATPVGPFAHYAHSSTVQALIMPTPVRSSHSVPTPVRSSHSLCPLQYGPTTHYGQFVQLQSFSSSTSPEACFSEFQPSHCSRRDPAAVSHVVLYCPIDKFLQHRQL